MLRHFSYFEDLEAEAPREAAVPPAPGKRTLTASIQRRAAGTRPPPAAEGAAPAAARAADDPFWFADAPAIAAEGTRGAGGALPYLAQIQTAFGRHDVGGVRAHQGGAAAAASAALGAEAFAFGDAVAFAGAPDLHTAAHEAAHVVQQRAGVQLAGGVGEVGDRYEQHADAVADRVVRGLSAEALLDELAGGGGGPAIQRRVTTLASEGNLLTDDEDGAANLEGLRQAARRTLRMLSANDAATVAQQAEQQHGKTPVQLLQGNLADVRALTALLRALSPDMAYGGAQGTFSWPQGQVENQRFEQILGWAVQTMQHIGNGQANAAITAVFGDAQAGTVRGRFAHVGAQLGGLAQAGRIYGDRTGSREAMDAGALTAFGRYIQMNRSFLGGNDDGGADAITLMHEALHYYYADITDEGGYPDQAEAFRTRPVATKLRNASHYEEVIRRYTGRNPLGGDFLPEDHQDAPERTPLQRAIGAASTMLQDAWERALNVHGFLVACHDHPDPGTRGAQLYFSSLFKLTMGGRAPRVDQHAALAVNDIDLVGVESATKMLSVMKGALRADLLTDEERQEVNVDTLRDLLLRKIVRGHGPLTGSVQRDLRVIAALAACPRDVSTVNAPPLDD